VNLTVLFLCPCRVLLLPKNDVPIPSIATSTCVLLAVIKCLPTNFRAPHPSASATIQFAPLSSISLSLSLLFYPAMEDQFAVLLHSQSLDLNEVLPKSQLQQYRSLIFVSLSSLSANDLKNILHLLGSRAQIEKATGFQG
jgi:hypothetical protein